MKMKKKETNANDVKGAASPSDGPSSVRNPAGEQRGPDRISATAEPPKRKRRKWTVEENKEIMFCYYQSKPSEINYRKRMHEIWQTRNNQPLVTEGNLADRVPLIKNKYLTKVQLKEIKDLAEGKKEEHTNEGENSQSNAEDPKINLEDDQPSPTVEEHEIGTQGENVLQLPDGVDKETYEKMKTNLENLKKQDITIPNLKQVVSRRRFSKTVDEVNKLAGCIPTKDISETLLLTKAAILTVCDAIGLDLVNKPKKKHQQKKTDPPWRKRMKAKLLEKRMDLSRLSEWKRNNLKNQQMKDYLTKKYGLHNVDIKEATEILKQEIAALKLKIDRYTTRCEFYRQNKLFETNQKRFYDQLDKKETKEPDKKPNKKKVLNFWSKIWGRTKQHNQDTDWISELCEKNSGNEKQDRLIITTSMVKKAIKKMKNWSSRTRWNTRILDQKPDKST